MDNDTDTDGNPREVYITNGERIVRAQRTALLKHGWRVVAPDELVRAGMVAEPGKEG